ncbi:hypothetical protein ScPMuIL_003961 [Solemya velum]
MVSSAFQVYLSWANSILVEVGKEIGSIISVQEGPILCHLIDALCPKAQLFNRIQPIGRVAQSLYIQTALDHMRNNGIKFNFTVQDIADGDIKSMLDVLWLLILHYCIHNIGRHTYQRSVGLGKKILLDWCQKQLDVEFDSRNTLTYNLTSGDWFIKLLKACVEVPEICNEDRTEELQSLLGATEKQHLIKKDIIQASDIVDGTVDEHTLMIYVSLLKRKVGDKTVVSQAPRSWDYIEKEPLQWTVIDTSPDTSPTPGKSSKTTSSASGETTDTTSDWLSSSSLSAVSLNEKFRPNQNQVMDSDQLIGDAINQRIMEQLPLPRDEEIVCHSSSLPHTSGEQLDLVDVNCTEKLKQLVNGNMDTQTDNSSNSTLEPNDIMNDISQGANSSVRVKRPRNHQSIMAEAREKKEMSIELGYDTPDGQRALFETRQAARREIVNRSVNAQAKHEEEQALRDSETSDIDRSESILSEDDDRRITIQAGTSSKVVTNGGMTPQDLFSQLSQGLPMVMLPSEGPEVALLLQALKQSEGGETNKLITPSRNYEKESSFSSDSEQTELKQLDLASADLHRKERYEMANGDRKSFNETTKHIDHLKPDQAESHNRSVPFENLAIGSNMNNLRAKSADRVLGRNHRHDYSHLRRAISPDSFTLQSPRASSENSHSQDGSYEPQKKNLPSPGRQPNQPDPSDGLVKVLTKEVEILKLKINAIEKRSVTEAHQNPLDGITRISFETGHEQKQHGRHHNSDTPHRGDIDDNDRESSEYRRSQSTRKHGVQSRFLEKDIDIDDTLHPRHQTNSAHIDNIHQHVRSLTPPAYLGRGTSRINSSTLSHHRSRSLPRSAGTADDMVLNHRPRPRIERGTLSAGATPVRGRSPIVTNDLSNEIPISQDNNGHLTFSPPRSRPISLGYSSPISKVPQEIWGNEAEHLESIHPKNQEKLRKLLAIVELGDGDIIELKQALATAVTENDILQAKLSNANTEITEKMSKTSEVLNESRSHLAKTQAENAELRSQLDRERSRADALEGRIRELESTVSTTKADNNDLEAELEGTVCLLKGATRQDVTVLTSLQNEIHHLRKRFDVVQKENTKLRKEIDEWDKEHSQTQMMIQDLKTCLDNAREERTQVIDELKLRNSYVRSGNSSFEKENYEKTEKHKLNGYVSQLPLKVGSGPTNTFLSASPYRKQQPSNYKNNKTYETIPSMKYRDYKPEFQSTFSSENLQNDSFLDEGEILPTVPSNTREIYPHRKTNSYINKYGNPYEETDYISPFEFFSDEGKTVGKLDLDMDLDSSYSQNVPLKENLSEHTKYEQLQNEKYEDIRERTSTPVNIKQDNVSSNRHTPNKDNCSTDQSGGRLLLESKNKQCYEEYCDDYDETTPEDRKFIDALINAVKDKEQNFIHALNSAVQDTSQRCYDDMDIRNPEEGIIKRRFSSSLGPGRSSSLSRTQSERVGRAELKGILKNTKSWQNMSIKRLHTTPPLATNQSKTETTGSEILFYKRRDDDTDYAKPVRYQAERPLEDNSDTRKPLTMRERKPYSLSSNPLAAEERWYANLLIDKYTKLPIRT